MYDFFKKGALVIIAPIECLHSGYNNRSHAEPRERIVHMRRHGQEIGRHMGKQNHIDGQASIPFLPPLNLSTNKNAEINSHALYRPSAFREGTCHTITAQSSCSPTVTNHECCKCN